MKLLWPLLASLNLLLSWVTLLKNFIYWWVWKMVFVLGMQCFLYPFMLVAERAMYLPLLKKEEGRDWGVHAPSLKTFKIEITLYIITFQFSIAFFEWVEWIENMLWRLCSAKGRYSCNREWNMQFFYEMTRDFFYFFWDGAIGILTWFVGKTN